MKKAIFIILIMAVLIGKDSRAYAQTDSEKRHGVIEIVDVYAPHFVAFKIAENNLVYDVKVSFINGTESLSAGTLYAQPVEVKMKDDGSWLTSYTDKTIICAMVCRVPTLFKMEKIKIEADGKVFYYDVINSSWDNVE